MAWPAVVVTALVVYHREVRRLFSRISELTLPGGAKAVFEAELDEATEKAEKIEPETTRGAVVPAPDDPFVILATHFPAQAVIREYIEIEGLLIEVAQQLDISVRAGRLDIAVQRLLDMQLISEDAYELFQSLRRARNAAAHARRADTITASEAFEYRKNAELL